MSITSTELNASATSRLLTNKNAMIFGAAGAVGSAVAKEFATQGAQLFLSGHHLGGVQTLAADIESTGGLAEAREIDVLDEPLVSAYLEEVVQRAGNIDVVVNLTGPRPQAFSNGRHTLDLPLEHFTLPLATLVPAQFVTARAAARHMVKQHSGVILFVTAIPSRGLANVSAIGSAFGAMESLTRCLAVDLGTSGVRVVCIRSGAMIDTPTIQASLDNAARQLSLSREQAAARLEQTTLLKRLPTAADTARLAAFLVSDAARAMTGVIINASSGSVID
jgi:NAD(P)-dependent dehydrogenase (short-subunit alcohol dehydrogenase family)